MEVGRDSRRWVSGGPGKLFLDWFVEERSRRGGAFPSYCTAKSSVAELGRRIERCRMYIKCQNQVK